MLSFVFFFTRPNVEFAGAKKQQLLFVEITACDGRTEKQQERPWLIALGRGSELGWERNATGGFSSSSPLSFPTCTLPFIRSLFFVRRFSFSKRVFSVVRRRRRKRALDDLREKLVFFFFDFALLYFPFWIREKLIGLLHCPAVRPRGIRNKRREETASDFDLVPTTLWSPRDDFFSPLFVMSCGR